MGRKTIRLKPNTNRNPVPNRNRYRMLSATLSNYGRNYMRRNFLPQYKGHMQMSMRNGITPKLTLTLTLTLTDTEGAVLTLMLGYRSLYITWQQHHNAE